MGFSLESIVFVVDFICIESCFPCEIGSKVTHLKGASFVEKILKTQFPGSSNKKQLCWNKFDHDCGKF